jgi:hypothetical protein
LVHAAQQLHAVEVRHVDVAEQHVHVALFKKPEGRLAVRRDAHVVAEAL